MILKDEYYIPAEKGEGFYKEKGSKFISFIFHVKNTEDVDLRLQELHKLHPKARHICYAYTLAPYQNQYRINDDGEPSGTAGKPIHGQILSHKLHETLIAVIRYFGGTKLGVPGLIRAYKTAAQEAIQNTNIVTTFISKRVALTFDYAIMGDLMNALKQTQLNIEKQQFDDNPKIILKLHESKANDDILKLKAQMLHRDVADVNEKTNINGLKINFLDE